MTLFVYVGTGTAVFFSNPKATDFVNSDTLLTNAKFAPLYSTILINSSFGITTAFAFGIGEAPAALTSCRATPQPHAYSSHVEGSGAPDLPCKLPVYSPPPHPTPTRDTY